MQRYTIQVTHRLLQYASQSLSTKKQEVMGMEIEDRFDFSVDEDGGHSWYDHEEEEFTSSDQVILVLITELGAVRQSLHEVQDEN